MRQGYNPNAEKDRLNREARDKALEAAAATGEPEITPLALEKARRKYMGHLEMAALVRDERVMSNLTIDGRNAEVKRQIGWSELDRLEYEHLRSLYEAQQRREAVAEAAALARENTEAARAQGEAAAKAAAASEIQARAATTQADAAEKQAALAKAQTEAATIQAGAARKQATAAIISVVVAVLVGLAVAVQACFLVAQYRLQKWQADHPAPAAAAPHDGALR
jgi:hypothetical protein